MTSPHPTHHIDQDSASTVYRIPGLLLARFDLAGQLRKASEAWLAAFDYTVDDIERMNLLDLIHPDDLIATIAAFHSIREQGFLDEFTNRYRRRDGTYRTLRWSAVLDQEAGAIHCKAADVTATTHDPVDGDLQTLLPLIAESTPAYLYLYDLRERRILYSNRRITASLGYSESDVASLDMAFDQNLLHPEDRQILDDIAGRVEDAADGQPVEAEYRFRHGDGTYRWLWNRCVVYARDENGLPVQVVGSLYDVTERREREDSYRQLFLHSPHPMYVFDMETLRFLAVNDAALALYGYSREEFLTMSIAEIRPEEEKQRLLDSVRTQGGHTEGEIWIHLKKNGERIYARVWSNDTSYMRRDARMVTVVDETEKLLAIERLSQASDTMEAVLHQSPVAIFAIDGNGRIQTWNPAASAIFAIGEDTAVGTELRRLTLGRSAALSQIQALVVQGDSVESHAFKARRRDGTSIELTLSARPLRDSLGRLSGAVFVVADVTAANRAERELRGLNTTLERRVEERTAEWEAANQELEAFCFSVAHDLRQPLRAIDGFSRAVIEDFGDRIDESGRDMLQRVRSAAQRMDEVTDALLALSRVTRTPLQREWVDLAVFANEAVNSLRNENPDRQVDVSIDPVMKAYGDSRLLSLLVQNLMENAWKFTSKTQDAHIEFTTDILDGHTIYMMRDNGAGVDLRYANKLFQPFERLHTVEEYPGHGIGLATCHRVVARHGGQISLVGSVGHGAAALFTLQPGP